MDTLSVATVASDPTPRTVVEAPILRKASYRVLVVLPIYNEEANLRQLLERIDEHLSDSFISYRVVVIDDGSTDRTAEILDEYSRRQPIDIHRHSVNQGLGAALRDGLSLAGRIAEDKDIVITMDADETHTPGLILRMVRMMREGHNVVIALRYQRGSVVRRLALNRRINSRLGSLLLRVILTISGVRNYTCGYRAYRADVLKSAMTKYGKHFVDQEGFQCMVD